MRARCEATSGRWLVVWICGVLLLLSLRSSRPPLLALPHLVREPLEVVDVHVDAIGDAVAPSVAPEGPKLDGVDLAPAHEGLVSDVKVGVSLPCVKQIPSLGGVHVQHEVFPPADETSSLEGRPKHLVGVEGETAMSEANREKGWELWVGIIGLIMEEGCLVGKYERV